jgi:hypothetical protein
MVFALAGDSTMTRCFPLALADPRSSSSAAVAFEARGAALETFLRVVFFRVVVFERVSFGSLAIMGRRIGSCIRPPATTT